MFEEGSILTVESDLYDADGISNEIIYQWYVDDGQGLTLKENGGGSVQIDNFYLTDETSGKEISVQAFFYDDYGNYESIFSIPILLQM